MKRQAITERIEFDYYDRLDALLKTGNRCSHCGKPLVPGPGMELDHFVPITRGGVNRKFNIMPLCSDCNDRKKNKIVSPDWYLKYINDDARKEIGAYFSSYMNSFEYLSRGNIFSCDMYELPLYIGPDPATLKKKTRDRVMKQMTKTYLLERMYGEGDEREEMLDFFIGYLKKYDILDSEKAATKNIEFWSRFGVIYCIREMNTDKIKMMLPITFEYSDRHDYNCMNVYIFSEYSTKTSLWLAMELPEFLSDILAKEQSLPYVRIVLRAVSADPIAERLELEGAKNPNTIAGLGFMIRYDKSIDPDTYNEQEHPFYRHLNDVEQSMKIFFEKEDNSAFEWMGNGIISNYREKQVAGVGSDATDHYKEAEGNG